MIAAAMTAAYALLLFKRMETLIDEAVRSDERATWATLRVFIRSVLWPAELMVRLASDAGHLMLPPPGEGV